MSKRLDLLSYVQEYLSDSDILDEIVRNMGDHEAIQALNLVMALNDIPSEEE